MQGAYKSYKIVRYLDELPQEDFTYKLPVFREGMDDYSIIPINPQNMPSMRKMINNQ